MYNDNCRNSCFVEITIGVIVGIISFLLLYSGVIAQTECILIAVLSVAGAAMIFLDVLSAINATVSERKLERCLRKNINCTIIGIVGSVISAVAAFAFSAEFAILLNVIIALSMAFGIITLLGLSKLIICMAGDND